MLGFIVNFTGCHNILFLRLLTFFQKLCIIGIQQLAQALGYGLRLCVVTDLRRVQIHFVGICTLRQHIHVAVINGAPLGADRSIRQLLGFRFLLVSRTVNQANIHQTNDADTKADDNGY